MAGLRRTRTVRMAVAAAVGIGVLAGAPQVAVAAEYRYAVVARDFRFQGVPSTLLAADYNTRFYNVGIRPHVVVAVNLGAGCQGLTLAQVMDLFDLPEEEVFGQCPNASVNGDVFAPPGQQSQGTLRVTSGQNWFVCFVSTPQGVPHYRLGMINEVRGISVG